MSLLFHIHVFFTLALTGLVWFVQVVHYPLYKKITPSGWVEYEKSHVKRTTWVTLYPMLVEATTGLTVLFIWFSQKNTSLIYYMTINGVLSLAIWISTIAIQVPLHQKLQNKHDIKLIKRLIYTNWIRVILWTLRAVLVLYIWTLLK